MFVQHSSMHWIFMIETREREREREKCELFIHSLFVVEKVALLLALSIGPLFIRRLPIGITHSITWFVVWSLKLVLRAQFELLDCIGTIYVLKFFKTGRRLLFSFGCAIAAKHHCSVASKDYHEIVVFILVFF